MLNIKERVVDGERHTYVIESILEMRKQGWLWTEKFMWHKKNSYPGKWPNRFRDNWERLIQFNKTKKFNMFQEAVMVPVGDWAKDRLAKLSDTDKVRDESKSSVGWQECSQLGRSRVGVSHQCDSHGATECANRNHSAAFPLDLPLWFIKLFTDVDDTVLDPFCGSGTTAVAAAQLKRHYVGIDISEAYCQLAKSRLPAQVSSRVCWEAPAT